MFLEKFSEEISQKYFKKYKNNYFKICEGAS